MDENEQLALPKPAGLPEISVPKVPRIVGPAQVTDINTSLPKIPSPSSIKTPHQVLPNAKPIKEDQYTNPQFEVPGQKQLELPGEKLVDEKEEATNSKSKPFRIPIQPAGTNSFLHNSPPAGYLDSNFGKINPNKEHDLLHHVRKMNQKPETTASISDELVLNKIADLVNPPGMVNPPGAPKNDGRGEVQDPKNDMRLKENQRKKEEEKERQNQERENEDEALQERVDEQTQKAGEDDLAGQEEHVIEEDVQTPYTRQRVDHRASQERLPAPGAFPMTTVQPEGFSAPKQRPAPKIKTESPKFGPEEFAIRNHPQYGQYANEFLGPKSNPAGLPNLYDKIKNLQRLASTDYEKSELQKLASKIAILIVKNR